MLRHRPRGAALTRLRVAIFGASFGKNVHAVGFARHPGFELAGLAGSDDDKARRLAAELGIPHASGDWRAVLEASAPDLVCVVTPVDLHHPMMMASLERGAHVLCEKPTALHRHQASEMRDAARRLGRVAAVNHEFRFQPARRAALAMVKDGAIGAPYHGVVAGRYPVWPRRGGRGMNWLSQAARGGGILGAMGSHHTDWLRTIFGEPRTVLASARVEQPWRAPTSEFPEGGVATADDACTLHYEFQDGAVGIVDLNASAHQRWERFEIHGDEASLRFEGPADRLWRTAPGGLEEEVEIPPELRLEHREGDHPLVAPFGVMVARLHDAILGRAPMDPSFDDAVAVQSALDAARASSDAGVRVRIEALAPSSPS